MVSSVSGSNNSDYLQQLLTQMMKNVSSKDTDATVGASKTDSTSVKPVDGKRGPDFLKMLDENFDKVDSDKNGELSKEEIKAARPPHPPAMGVPPGLVIEDMFAVNDTDGTAGLSKTELSSINPSHNQRETNFVKKLTHNFDKIDTNQDGQLSTEEIDALRPKGLETAATENGTQGQSSSAGNNAGLEDKIANIADYFFKQLLSAYKESGSSVKTSLNAGLKSALDVAV